MKKVFVQVCFESTGYTRAIKATALSRLNQTLTWHVLCPCVPTCMLPEKAFGRHSNAQSE